MGTITCHLSPGVPLTISICPSTSFRVLFSVCPHLWLLQRTIFRPPELLCRHMPRAREFIYTFIPMLGQFLANGWQWGWKPSSLASGQDNCGVTYTPELPVGMKPPSVGLCLELYPAWLPPLPHPASPMLLLISPEMDSLIPCTPILVPGSNPSFHLCPVALTI